VCVGCLADNACDVILDLDELVPTHRIEDFGDLFLEVCIPTFSNLEFVDGVQIRAHRWQ
jgi:hypothetical protein